MVAVIKNLIVQIYCSLDGFSEPERLKKHDEIFKISTVLAEAYAKRCNADYLLITEPVINFRHPTYERLRLWEEPIWFEKYDQILYLDSDVFCWPHAPNIFQEYSSNEFKTAFLQKIDLAGNPSDIFNETLYGKYTRQQLHDISFNAGVFMLTREARNIMLPHLNFRNSSQKADDSVILHKLILDSNVPYLRIPAEWNKKNGDKDSCYFSHLWGLKKHENPNLRPVLEAREIIQNDDI